ncbi:hypothetical protein LZ30DRAFT_219547 [Colletotrichum cereale]|nr:hypothetical protein LZ30DRAFT_219547 [Colletotrichum cereale]
MRHGLLQVKANHRIRHQRFRQRSEQTNIAASFEGERLMHPSPRPNSFVSSSFPTFPPWLYNLPVYLSNALLLLFLVFFQHRPDRRIPTLYLSPWSRHITPYFGVGVPVSIPTYLIIPYCPVSGISS